MNANRRQSKQGHMTRCLAGLVLLLLPAGCLTLDEEHCLANGGDLACPGRRCLLETGQAVKPRVDDRGCSLRDSNYDYHVHLEYGLPAASEFDGSTRYLDTLEGILVTTREANGIDGSCPLNSTELQDELDAVLDRHSWIYVLRARMEQQGRVRTRPATMTQAEVDDVKAYNDAVNDWLDACLEKTASEVP